MNPVAENELLTASLEDYLEAIYLIVNEKQAARAKDIARRLSVHNSSVTGALHALADRGLINYAPYEIITLTPEGESAGREIVLRHEALKNFFLKVLAVAEPEAEEAACRMEHAVQPDLLERFVRFVEFVETCPRGGSQWLAQFEHFLQSRICQSDCPSCIRQCLRDVEVNSPCQTVPHISLAALKPGHRARIVDLGSQSSSRALLETMGAVTGVLIEAMQHSDQMGDDTLCICMNGHNVALDKTNAADIYVEVL